MRLTRTWLLWLAFVGGAWFQIGVMGLEQDRHGGLAGYIKYISAPGRWVSGWATWVIDASWVVVGVSIYTFAISRKDRVR